MLDRWWTSRRRVRLPVPVISIGNLTLGGTGKTPVLIYIANALVAEGKNVAILSRGYGSDEIALVKQKCPEAVIGVGANRVARARELLTEHPIDVFVLDDGFQHWAIARDLDIVCVDATRPLTKEKLFPAGRLREPACGLRRARIGLLTRSDLVPTTDRLEQKRFLERNLPKGSVVESVFKNELMGAATLAPIGIDRLGNKRIVAVSAIGNPQAFEAGLSDIGTVVASLRFRDHHDYSPSDANRIRRAAKEADHVIVTTEKDWVKLKKFDWTDVPVYVRKIELSIGESDLATWQSAIHAVFK